jgi:dihydroxyacetone kinase DhaKLM complex PTS-EIIA-like component DhaM
VAQVGALVGIVLVSHSGALAAGAAELAGQVSGGTVRVLPAGGTDDGELGTSADKISAAVAEAEAGAGVVVLPDLGSAVLTVRALLADAPDEPPGSPPGRGNGCAPDTMAVFAIGRATVVLVDAPFVEGAVAATVTAAAGLDLKAVAQAAEEAWHARKL